MLVKDDARDRVVEVAIDEVVVEADSSPDVVAEDVAVDESEVARLETALGRAGTEAMVNAEAVPEGLRCRLK